MHSQEYYYLFHLLILIIAFKSHKKFIEKEVSTIVNKITQLKKAGSSKGGSDYVVETLDSLISKLNQLKSKVSPIRFTLLF